MLSITKIIFICICVFSLIFPAQAASNTNTESTTTTNRTQHQQAIYSDMARHHPVWAKEGMVSSQEALATQIGVDILAKGGNAIDAAVAVGYALAVTLPRAGNLGGGGFMMIYLADEKRTIALDYREMAPLKAHKDMFLDHKGNADKKLSRFHGLAVGIPGTVMGMEHALAKYGTMTRKEVMAPAINLARNGIVVTADLANSLNNLYERLAQWPSSHSIFYKKDGSSYQPGERLFQTDLANSLALISSKGNAGFYQGSTANKISTAVQKAGGVLSIDDFNHYKVVERQAVTGDYRGYQITSMPPPSSGGVHVIQMLNMLEQYPIETMGHNTSDTIHVMAESMRQAYADRSKYLGDPDFVDVPVSGLINKQYAKNLVANINPDKANLSKDIAPGVVLPYESNETTHFSVIDKFGNAVSNTYTLNFSYGSGLVAQGTGILLNNEMDDFSAKPGSPNGYGLIGGKANAVAPYKRPLSSMTPVIILKDNKPYIITGSPGGSRIITTTLQIIMNVIDHKMNIAEATAAPRIHHQWLPDYLRIEKGISKDTIQLLKAKGHKVKIRSSMGSTQSIRITDKGVFGSSDPRRPSALSKGHN